MPPSLGHGRVRGHFLATLTVPDSGTVRQSPSGSHA
jgi:hypothetical protein